MKIKFTDNGQIIETENTTTLVDFMRNDASHVGAKTNLEYMVGYASRCVISSDIDVRAYNEDVFFEDLLKFKRIEIVE